MAARADTVYRLALSRVIGGVTFTTQVVFNDPTDPDYVGVLTEPPTGLDGAPVRESGEDFTERDGGAAGPGFLSRRPVMFRGVIVPSGNATTDNARSDKLSVVGNLALREDVTLTWTQPGRVQTRLLLRTASRPVISNRRPKQFELAFVASQPFIEAAVESSNQGLAGVVGGSIGVVVPVTTGDLPPALRIVVKPQAGQTATAFTIAGPVAGDGFGSIPKSTTSAQSVTVDLEARTIVHSDGTNLYGAALASGGSFRWFSLPPGGTNAQRTITFTAAGAQVDATVYRRERWLA